MNMRNSCGIILILYRIKENYYKKSYEEKGSISNQYIRYPNELVIITSNCNQKLDSLK